jgi:hypothetical protein
MAALELDHRIVPLAPYPAIIPQTFTTQSLRQNLPIGEIVGWMRLARIPMRIPTQSGRGFRFDVGRRSEMKTDGSELFRRVSRAS